MTARLAAEPAGLDAILADHSDAIAALALRLRTVVLDAHPGLTEKVYPGWHGLGFHHPTQGYVGALFPRDTEVKFGFEHGADLPDPHKLLEGSGRRLRYLNFTPGEASPTEAQLVDYLDLALGD
jgi:hypothetical protein